MVLSSWPNRSNEEFLPTTLITIGIWNKNFLTIEKYQGNLLPLEKNKIWEPLEKSRIWESWVVGWLSTIALVLLIYIYICSLCKAMLSWQCKNHLMWTHWPNCGSTLSLHDSWTQIPKYIKLVEIVVVQVICLVEVEQCFPYTNFVRSELRKRLTTHLKLVIHIFSHNFFKFCKFFISNHQFKVEKTRVWGKALLAKGIIYGWWQGHSSQTWRFFSSIS